MRTNLDDCPRLRPVRVLALDGEPRLRERLTEIGFTVGTSVQVLRRAPLGDPVHIAVRGGSFALRRSEARAVIVEDTL